MTSFLLDGSVSINGASVCKGNERMTEENRIKTEGVSP